MQTQGISLVTSKLSGQKVSKSTKANDATFDGFMANRAAKVNQGVQKNADKAMDSFDRKANAVSLKKGSAAGAKNAGTQDGKMPQAARQMGQEEIAEVDPTVVVSRVMVLLQEIFGMAAEDIQDILDQAGVTLDGMMGLSWEEGAAKELLQGLVMDVHGITDKAAFLTNDTLVQELSTLDEQMTQILADTLGVAADELPEVDPEILASLAGRLETVSKAMGAGDGTPAVTEEAARAADNAAQASDMAEGSLASEQGIPVIVEDMTGDSEGEGQTAAFAGERLDNKASDVHNTDHATAANLFAERLAEAFEASGSEETAPQGTSMTEIVDQIVNQVKIRVMPETTSMEIALHPEHLGRVNLQVSATGSAVTATLAVETEAARKAIESQLITLKETFEEQGLKVDAVEVTVSDFGLHQEQRQAQQDQKNGARHRRFREDVQDDGEQDGSVETGTQTAPLARRDANSMVDYTA